MARDSHRVAVVDIGSNSTRLLIADVEAGRVSEVERQSRVTRLGRGVDLSGQLSGRGDRGGLRGDRRLRRDLPRGRRRADRRDRDQRRARRLQRQRLRRRAARALRALRPRARRRGGGAAHLPRRHLRAPAQRADPGRRHRRRLDRADRRHRRGDRLPHLAAGRRRPPQRAPHRQPTRRPRSRAGGARRRRSRPDREPRSRSSRRSAPAPGSRVAGTPTSLASIEIGLEPYDPKQVHGHTLTLASIQRPALATCLCPTVQTG